MIAIPLALILGIVGVIRDTRKVFSVIAMIVSGLALLLFFGLPFLMMLIARLSR